MSNVFIPTLDVGGLTDDPNIKIASLFNYFISSVPHQTTVDRNEIKCLVTLLMEYGTSPNRLASEVRTSLVDIYSQSGMSIIFIEVDVRDINEIHFDLTINISMQHEKRAYTLNRALEIFNNQVTKIFEGDKNVR